MNSTEMNFEELADILAKECEVHEHVLQASRLVNSAIKESDLDTLQKHTAYLDSQVFQVGQLEERRKDCCGALARALGIGRPQVRLAALIEKAPAAIAGRLAGLHGSLRGALDKIFQMNVSNRVLLEEGLQLVRGRLELVVQSAGHFGGYGQRGGRATSKLPLHPFINRTA